VGAARDGTASGDDQEGLDPIPPEGGYELYRHKNAGEMETKNWHGLTGARRNEEGDYEVRSVPTSWESSRRSVEPFSKTASKSTTPG
jgi:hypothetical protein